MITLANTSQVSQHHMRREHSKKKRRKIVDLASESDPVLLSGNGLFDAMVCGLTADHFPTNCGLNHCHLLHD